MKRNFFEITAAALFTIIVITAPMQSLKAARDALALCENSVIPALFPFFVCSGMLVRLGAAAMMGKALRRIMTPVFGLSGCSSLAMVMGLISGYPVGAKTAASLVCEGSCHKSEGEKLLAFCNNSGPLFILGAVGSGMLGSNEAGVILYTSHLLSAFTIALLMRNIRCRITPESTSPIRANTSGFGGVLTDSISSASELVFTVSGFVVVFNILISALEHFGFIRGDAARVAVCGLLEPTNGCIAAVRAIKNPVLLYMTLSAIIGWSGISVHLQVLGIIKTASLSPKYYFAGKALMSFIAPIYTFRLIKIFPPVVPAAAFGKNFDLPGIYCSSLEYFAVSLTATAVFLVFSTILYNKFKNCNKKVTRCS